MFILKKFFISIIFNSIFLLLLIIGIQNSGNKKKVDLLIAETVNVPVGFIIGTSFISGSIIGSLLPINSRR